MGRQINAEFDEENFHKVAVWKIGRWELLLRTHVRM
jgi:hypothetical protein